MMELAFNSLVTRTVSDYLVKMVVILFLLGFTNLLIKYLKVWLGKLLRRTKAVPAMITFATELIRLLVWLVCFTAILTVLGFGEVALIIGGSVAVVSVVLAQSVSHVVEDLIVGIFLIFDEDIQVGYRVRVNEIVGVIESLGIRKTKIRDQRGSLYIIPNKVFDTDVVVLSKR